MGIGIAFGGECSDETLQRMRHGGWVRSKVAKGDGEGGCGGGGQGDSDGSDGSGVDVVTYKQ